MYVNVLSVLSTLVARLNNLFLLWYKCWVDNSRICTPKFNWVVLSLLFVSLLFFTLDLLLLWYKCWVDSKVIIVRYVITSLNKSTVLSALCFDVKLLVPFWYKCWVDNKVIYALTSLIRVLFMSNVRGQNLLSLSTCLGVFRMFPWVCFVTVSIWYKCWVDNSKVHVSCSWNLWL